MNQEHTIPNYLKEITQRQCICDDETLTDAKECVICHIKRNEPASKQLREYFCKVHKIISCCGMYEYVCEPCKEQGWYSTAGFGGPTQHVNTKTGERKNIPYNYKTVNDDIF